MGCSRVCSVLLRCPVQLSMSLYTERSFSESSCALLEGCCMQSSLLVASDCCRMSACVFFSALCSGMSACVLFYALCSGACRLQLLIELLFPVSHMLAQDTDCYVCICLAFSKRVSSEAEEYRWMLLSSIPSYEHTPIRGQMIQYTGDAQHNNVCALRSPWPWRQVWV